jgi:hypothetical protein
MLLGITVVILGIMNLGNTMRLNSLKPVIMNAIQIPEDAHLLQKWDHFKSLYSDGSGNEILLDCYWAPTAINYAEDADCATSLPLNP